MSETYVILDVAPTAAEFRALCIGNDWARLERLHKRLRDGTRLVANSLRGDGFTILNCSAGNVTGRASFCSRNSVSLKSDISSLLGEDMPFKFGTGSSLKAAYLAAFDGDGEPPG
jgi:hypothetical protein